MHANDLCTFVGNRGYHLMRSVLSILASRLAGGVAREQQRDSMNSLLSHTSPPFHVHRLQPEELVISALWVQRTSAYPSESFKWHWSLIGRTGVEKRERTREREREEKGGKEGMAGAPPGLVEDAGAPPGLIEDAQGKGIREMGKKRERERSGFWIPRVMSLFEAFNFIFFLWEWNSQFALIFKGKTLFCPP